MTDFAPHPARSAEFLSRLHDGDLSAAERAQFESHRAHCAGCRNAAAEFEAALALYRSSRPQPPKPDLSVRILRKLQAASPRRSPFGVSFGIDLRWAGAFVAALIAVIIGSSVVLRREAAERKLLPESTPIPIRIESGRVAGLEKDRLAAPSGAPRSDAPSRDERPAPAAPPQNKLAPETKRELAQAPQERSSAASKPGLLDKEKSVQFDFENQRVAEAKPQVPAAALSSSAESPALEVRRSDQSQSGGEGASDSNFAYDKLSTRVRLEITAIDGAGAAPTLANGDQIDLPTDLRGKEFVLVVEANGRVRNVEPAEAGPRKKTLMRQQSGRSGAAQADAKAPQTLADLRFAVSDRPRVLRVRVE